MVPINFTSLLVKAACRFFIFNQVYGTKIFNRICNNAQSTFNRVPVLMKNYSVRFSTSIIMTRVKLLCSLDARESSHIWSSRLQSSELHKQQEPPCSLKSLQRVAQQLMVSVSTQVFTRSVSPTATHMSKHFYKEALYITGVGVGVGGTKRVRIFARFYLCFGAAHDAVSLVAVSHSISCGIEFN